MISVFIRHLNNMFNNIICKYIKLTIFILPFKLVEVLVITQSNKDNRISEQTTPHFMLLLSIYVLYSNVTYISCIMSCGNKIVSNCFKKIVTYKCPAYIWRNYLIFFSIHFHPYIFVMPISVITNKCFIINYFLFIYERNNNFPPVIPYLF